MATLSRYCPDCGRQASAAGSKPKVCPNCGSSMTFLAPEGSIPKLTPPAISDVQTGEPAQVQNRPSDS